LSPVQGQLSYLEQIFARLRKHGLVASTRGPGGGYRLSRDANAISVADVIGAVDEVVDATRCGGMENCQGEQRCLTHDLWQDLSRQIRHFLTDIDLAQLVQRNSIQEVAARQDAIQVSAPRPRPTSARRWVTSSAERDSPNRTKRASSTGGRDLSGWSLLSPASMP